MFFLSHHNVVEYLSKSGVFTQQELLGLTLDVGKLNTKNFSIIATLKDGRKFIVKQERPTLSGIFSQEIFNEWQFQSMMGNIAHLNPLQGFIREMLTYDHENFIAIYKYLDDYQELYSGILRSRQVLPVTIPGWIGAILAQIHRATFNCEEAYNYVTQPDSFWHKRGAAFILLQHRITPELLSVMPPDYIKFIGLYQRYESLDQAKVEAINSWRACCVVHNDLNVANILVHQDWENITSFALAQKHSAVKIIDWERSSWGDPIFDLANLIANYVILWIVSMVIDPSMSMQESINSAEFKLEDVRPSILVIVREYLQHFPEITQHFPDFFKKLIQFMGVALIIQTQAKIEHHKQLVNSDIYSLQVAKSLLCRPEASLVSILGVTEKELAGVAISA
ncbi:aminoglycoside phosphotransferase family protein [Nostoc sp. CMAA1605]|uniref:aminoglycoside phosphotransferase family protein n=1 Tax=Nostoc sp. CMAA1605 TaxID=2055159 RepID=UPI001F2A95FC|nr:aminoglycoside phosphotransferase family protein [Nostoc sp. CMAA1605]MCF4970622.1 LPS biosynthesis choline kinase [Nostoc sp. CMAA1605]